MNKLIILAALFVSGCATGPYNPQAAAYWANAFQPAEAPIVYQQPQVVHCQSNTYGFTTTTECR